MDDRELLELAALAAGMEVGTYKFQWYEDIQSFVRHEPDEDGISGPWNSLDDDADALRLAVKLDIQIWRRPSGVEGVHKYSILTKPQTEPLLPDRYAATRRAITRAAAEIYKAMKNNP